MNRRPQLRSAFRRPSRERRSRPSAGQVRPEPDARATARTVAAVRCVAVGSGLVDGSSADHVHVVEGPDARVLDPAMAGRLIRHRDQRGDPEAQLARADDLVDVPLRGRAAPGPCPARSGPRPPASPRRISSPSSGVFATMLELVVELRVERADRERAPFHHREPRERRRELDDRAVRQPCHRVVARRPRPCARSTVNIGTVLVRVGVDQARAVTRAVPASPPRARCRSRRCPGATTTGMPSSLQQRENCDDLRDPFAIEDPAGPLLRDARDDRSAPGCSRRSRRTGRPTRATPQIISRPTSGGTRQNSE